MIESVPNISEGRNLDIVEKIVDQVRETEGCILMNYSSDENHNRSVITYMGSPSAVEEASFKIAEKAKELIDLREHKGVHPRMGAVDVMPFVPLRGATMAECVSLSERVGKRISEELEIPVFLYEESATSEERRNLAVIRNGEFEGMSQKLLKKEWKPDYGTDKVHKTAGVMAIGARKPLIAYNIQLGTSDVEIAKKISETIRESSGGMKKVKAIGVMLESKNIAQVSMNLTDYKETPPHIAVERVKTEAKRYGVEVIGTELIGMMPMEAIAMAGAYYLQIENFDMESNIIESFIK